MTQALNNRPDLAQARLQLQNSQVSLKASKNALLPELNVFARVQNNSLGSGQEAGRPDRAISRVQWTTARACRLP